MSIAYRQHISTITHNYIPPPPYPNSPIKTQFISCDCWFSEWKVRTQEQAVHPTIYKYYDFHIIVINIIILSPTNPWSLQLRYRSSCSRNTFIENINVYMSLSTLFASCFIHYVEYGDDMVMALTLRLEPWPTQHPRMVGGDEVIFGKCTCVAITKQWCWTWETNE